MNRLNERTLFRLRHGLYEMICEEDKKLIKKMCAEHNTPLETFLNRIHGGMSFEEALNSSVPRYKSNCNRSKSHDSK